MAGGTEGGVFWIKALVYVFPALPKMSPKGSRVCLRVASGTKIWLDLSIINSFEKKVPPLGAIIISFGCVHAQLCPTLWNPMDCSPPDSTVHGIFPARILEWVTISSSRASS